MGPMMELRPQESPPDPAPDLAPDLAPEDPRLLAFYDRLRRRVVAYVERREGKLAARFGPGAAQALLLAPDVFILLARLALDPQVPGRSRALVGGALAYFLLPMDLFPEMVIGPAGFLDDLILAAGVLAEAFSGSLEPLAERHWSGRDSVRQVLRDVADSGRALLGDSLYGRVQGLLKRGKSH
jgi:uncharacterized membrane protein YkvA (DUF1232 family)